MGKYKELIHKLPEERETMELLTDITDEFVESVKITQPQKYANLMNKLKALATTGHFTKEIVESINDNWHWTVEDTTNYVKQTYEVNFDKEPFNEYDFNFVMNDMYKLYYPVFQDDTAKYAELTLAWLDQNNGKAYCYYEKMYK